MRTVEFENSALEQFYKWQKDDANIFEKIVRLVAECRETPFEGIGKPEALKHNLKGCWSRRINREHRLVYKVTADTIVIISCKFHY